MATTLSHEPIQEKTSTKRDLSVRVAAIGLTLVLLVALALRLYGLNWDEGFGWTPHPDERAILSKVTELSPPSLGELSTLLDADESPWNPRWFPYGSFPLYFLKGVDLLSEYVPGLEINDLRVPGRAISALADVVTVALVYMLGVSVWSRRVGLIAAGLVALAVIHIQLSHFFAVDTVMALFAVLTLYFLVKVARHGRPMDSALAGLFLGLGLATKISVAPILAAYFVAHFMYAFGLVQSEDGRNWILVDRITETVKSLAIGGLVALGVFFIVQPYTFLDWDRFYSDVIEQSEMVRRIRDYPYTRQYVDTTPYIYHLRQLTTWGLGWPLGVVAWAGMLYVAVRGLRFPWAVAYLAAGFGLPVAILLVSNSLAGIFVSSAMAIAALAATTPLRRPETRIDALLLSWVAPYFFITGAFDVKFLRYLIPITPFLLLFGSRMIVGIWDGVSGINGRFGRPVKVVTMVLGAVFLAATAFYAVSYTGIYTTKHPAVEASEWIRANIPEDSVVLKEHWEEGLPDLHGYTIRELPLYEDDRPGKINHMSEMLAGGDIITFYSNRLYGTVGRLEERYPVSREYYKLLFAGQLGYQLDSHFTSYPNLFGVGFIDDTFTFPDLPVPFGLVGADPEPVSLNLGFADESFSVYDHPKVLIFRNVSRLDAEVIADRITSASGGFPSDNPGVTAPSGSGSTNQLLLTADQTADRQAGGTWSEIIDSEGWASRAPALAWIIVIEGTALLVFPIAFVVFRPLKDKGWLFAKGLGLLLVGLVTWLLSSLELMTFTSSAVGAGVLIIFAISLALLIANRTAIRSFFKDNWKTLATAEFIFLAAFVAFTIVRMANPDLWHPFRGGEKPMDMAYLNAVLKSSYMPPYDPWFGGGYINYYYWGQFLVATMIHATGIIPDVAVNLAVPMFFAMTIAFSYSVVFNLASAAQVRGRIAGGLSPVIAGLAGALFVAVLGNLDGAIQVGQGAWRAIVEGVPVGEFDFWRSSRMMAPDPPGHEITEFPFFTFLFADPHAHLMALPFTVLSVGVAAAVVLGLARQDSIRSVWSPVQFTRIAILGVSVGALRLLNTWDYPTYLLFGMAAVTLAEYLAQGGLSFAMLVRSGIKSVLVFAIGYATFLPYHLNYETFFSSVESTTNKTVLWQFLAITGLFVFIIGSFYLWELRGLFAPTWNRGRSAFRSLTGAVTGEESLVASRGQTQIGVGALLAIIGSILLLGYVATALSSGFSWDTVLFVGVLLVLIVAVAVRVLIRQDGDAPVTAFVSLVAATGFGLVLGLDFFRVEGDIDRMNSIFKFYLQVWVLLALAAAYLTWRIAGSDMFRGAQPWKYRGVWTGALAVLLVSAAAYPVIGTQDRLRDRFEGNVTELTLNGIAYVPGTTYRDARGQVDLAADFEGINWLRENVQGSPIVLEANTPTYRWGGRISIYTGLPSVVGWQWHQEQQRWDYRPMVSHRISEVERIYSTTDPAEANALLSKYDVEYIYLGQLERLYYPESGIAKFATDMSPYLQLAFASDQVSIYRVLD